MTTKLFSEHPAFLSKTSLASKGQGKRERWFSGSEYLRPERSNTQVAHLQKALLINTTKKKIPCRNAPERVSLSKGHLMLNTVRCRTVPGWKVLHLSPSSAQQLLTGEGGSTASGTEGWHAPKAAWKPLQKQQFSEVHLNLMSPHHVLTQIRSSTCCNENNTRLMQVQDYTST